MVLPQSALGAPAKGLEVDLGSGFTNNTVAAAETIDPTDTAAQLTRADRITGYELSYSDLSAAPFARGSGLVTIGSSVELFRSARAADAHLSKQLNDAKRLVGKPVDSGVRLTSATRFPAGSLGQRTVGLRLTGLVAGRRIRDTSVAFRQGALLAGVTVERRRQERRDAHQAARKSPRNPGAARSRRQARGAARRGSTDRPQGARSTRYRPRGHGAERRRPPRGGGLGHAGIHRRPELDGDLPARLHPSRGVPRDRRLPAPPRGGGVRSPPRPAHRLRVGGSGAVPYGRLRRSHARPRAAAGRRRGDESIVLVLRFSAQGNSFRIALVSFRVDRVVGSLTLVEPAASFDLSTVEPLAQAFAERIRAGL